MTAQVNMNSTNGLLGELRVAKLSQKPDFVCALRTQNRAIDSRKLLSSNEKAHFPDSQTLDF
jgi:hypothetical protein